MAKDWSCISLYCNCSLPLLPTLHPQCNCRRVAPKHRVLLVCSSKWNSFCKQPRILDGKRSEDQATWYATALHQLLFNLHCIHFTMFSIFILTLLFCVDIPAYYLYNISILQLIIIILYLYDIDQDIKLTTYRHFTPATYILLREI